MGAIMGPLDGSILNIALPAIASEFQAPLRSLEWVVMSYLLVASATLLIFGRMGDLYGQKRIYIAGFAVFTVGSFACSLAPNISSMVAFRVVQALGASMMIAMGPAIITRVFPPTERGMALGINSMVVAVGLASGPTLGGILVENIGWRSIFWINVPIGLLAIVWAWRVLPEGGRDARERFDILGAALFFVALFGLLMAASNGPALGWSSPAILTLVAVSGAAFALFLWTERTVPAPMVDLSLFRNRVFVSAAVSCLLNFMAQNTVTFLMPFYLQNAMAYSAREAGLIMSSIPVVMMFLAPISGALSDRYGSGVLSPLGMAMTTLGVWLLSRLTLASSTAEILAYLLVFGLGSGLFGAPNNSALMGSAPRNKAGVASGILAMMRNTGMVLGVALSGAIVDARLSLYGGGGSLAAISAVDPAAFLYAQRGALVVGTVLAGTGVLTSLVRSGKEQREAAS